MLDALRAGGLFPDALCGGNGKCGKCAVDIIAGMRPGRYLACQTIVGGDMTLALPEGAFRRADMPQSRLLGAQGGEPPDAIEDGGLYAVFDIGTTSLVCLLLEQGSNRTLAAVSGANPQAAYGADVISRIQYAGSSGLETLRQAVLDGLNALLALAAREAGVRPEAVTRVCLVGNSCMHHLFFGLSPDTLGRAPYAPIVRETVIQNARKAGLCAHPDAELVFLPLIAGFVGADTVGCLLAEGFDLRAAPALLIDIGTNGELALTDGKRRFACSTAAGPAFEGARIRFGMRGERGAIDHVRFDPKGGALQCSVIGGGAARGLCGSGLLDAAAMLLALGAVDETGRMLAPNDCGGLHPALAARMTLFEEKPAFALAYAGENGAETDVLLTQQDIRELQLAKGALAAGIRLLAQTAGLEITDIREVLLAGAFGSFLTVSSACAIGLIPAALEARTAAVGNAALSGARLALTLADGLSRAESLAADTAFVELASCPAFQDVFIDELAFPSRAGA